MSKKPLSTKIIIKLIFVLNCVFTICSFLSLLLIFLSYAWTDTPLVSPIHTLITVHLSHAYYALSILTVLAIFSKLLVFFLSLFQKKSEILDINSSIQQLTSDFMSSSTTIEKALVETKKHLLKIEKQEEDIKNWSSENCNQLQQELSYAEQRVSLFTVENQQNLYRNIKCNTDFSHNISKLEVSQKLTQVIDLLEKAKTDIQTR